MFDFTLNLDRKGLKTLGELKGKARLGAAKALTFTAKDAQEKLKADVAADFHLRNRWVPQGIRIKPATSANLSARVGSIDKYMGRHVVGDDEQKSPAAPLTVFGRTQGSGRISSGGLLIMPYGSIADAPTHTVVRRKLARIDGQKRKTFQIMSKNGNVLVVRRKGKKASSGLDVLGIIEGKAVKIRRRFDIYGSVSTVVGARFPEHFGRQMEKLQN